MAIHLRHNPYQGINAHLNSVLQNTYAGWEEFHGLHSADIARGIDALLPPRYAASYERSFQITALPAAKVFSEAEDYLRAVSIRSLDDNVQKVVAWIELLSPSNKPPASGYGEYHAKRTAALEAGIVFVELDYLHQSRPVIDELSAYPEDRTFPYYIDLTDPRPTLHESIVEIYSFMVDQPLPKIRIPLLDGESVTVDFSAIYKYTFESFRRFSDLVDYTQEPPHINTYSPADQERIRAIMATVSRDTAS